MFRDVLLSACIRVLGCVVQESGRAMAISSRPLRDHAGECWLVVIAHACTGSLDVSGGCGSIWLVAAAHARHVSCAVALPCAAVSN